MSNNITNNYLILHSSYYLTPETHLDTNLHIIIYSLVFSCDQVPTKTALDRCYGDIQYAKLGEEATAFQTSLSSFLLFLSIFWYLETRKDFSCYCSVV